MFMPASFTRPKIAHTALVNIPRKPRGYQRGAAIWTMVKCFTHATPHPGFGRCKVLRDRGSLITKRRPSEGKALDETLSTASLPGSSR